MKKYRVILGKEYPWPYVAVRRRDDLLKKGFEGIGYYRKNEMERMYSNRIFLLTKFYNSFVINRLSRLKVDLFPLEDKS